MHALGRKDKSKKEFNPRQTLVPILSPTGSNRLQRQTYPLKRVRLIATKLRQLSPREKLSEHRSQRAVHEC